MAPRTSSEHPALATSIRGTLRRAASLAAVCHSPVLRKPHVRADLGDAVHRRRLSLGVLGHTRAARPGVALRLAAGLAPRPDRPDGELRAVRRPRVLAASLR